MLWLPFDKLTLYSPMPLPELRAALEAQCGTGPSLRPQEPKTFYGTVEHDQFRILRSIWFSNAFRPVIIGRLRPEGSATLIHLRLRMMVFGMVFMSIWIGVSLIPVAVALLSFFGGNTPFQSVHFILIAFPLVGYGFSMGSFLFERGKGLQELKRILRASEFRDVQ